MYDDYDFGDFDINVEHDYDFNREQHKYDYEYSEPIAKPDSKLGSGTLQRRTLVSHRCGRAGDILVHTTRNAYTAAHRCACRWFAPHIHTDPDA